MAVKKPLVRLVPFKVLMQTNPGKDLAGSLEALDGKVLPAIGQRIAVAEAALQGLTVGEYSPGSAAHDEFVELTKAVERLRP